LIKEGIENTLDQNKEGQFVLWIHDEDQIEKAKNFLNEFQQNPEDKKFDVSYEEIAPLQEDQEIENFSEEEVLPEESQKEEARGFFHFFTISIIILCSFIYLMNLTQEAVLAKKAPYGKGFLFTPVQKAFLYDLTSFEEKKQEVIEKHQLDLSNIQQGIKVTPEQKTALDELMMVPHFQGFDQLILRKIHHKEDSFSFPPMFEKIQKGQIWRIWTPAILHTAWWHILFNMIWVWVLGKLIEERISKKKFFLLIVITAAVSNTFQYLMAGPLFLGFSGVVLGMAGFIFARQRVAPWEGYPLPRSTIYFLGFFVVAMAVLSFISFFMQALGGPIFSAGIGNTAHLSGAFTGYILGKMKFFKGRAP